MKKYYKLCTIILFTIIGSLILIKCINPILLATDSGFDSSYDSGGFSGGSDYSFGGGSDYSFNDTPSYSYGDNSSKSSSRGNSNSYRNDELLLLLFLLIIVIVLIKRKPMKKNMKNDIQTNNTAANHNDMLKKYMPDIEIEKFIEERYRDFVEVQIAWMDFDYEKLRELLTDELYNQYEMQLDTLKLKNEKNVMSDFSYESAYISNVSRDKDNLIIRVRLSVSFFDYITKDEKITRGTDKEKIHMTYELTYITALKNDISKCPSCGAPISNNASVKCEYCNSIISRVSEKWVMKNKKAISQR